MYKQLEEVMKKCDSLSQQIKIVKKDVTLELNAKFNIERNKYESKIEQLESKVDALTKENTLLKEENKKLKNEVDRLKSQVNKDSNNSSNPPSSDIKPNKRDIPNNREKSNKKVGGQKGHKGFNLCKKDVEEKIRTKKYKHEISVYF